MAGNSTPIFSRVGTVGWGSSALTAANTAMDGTGTVLTIFAADATNGGYVRNLRAKAAGTNIATVARIFINNGSTNATAANNILIDELALPATVASNSANTTTMDLPLAIALDPGFVINVAIGTAVSAGWYFSVFGGKY